MDGLVIDQSVITQICSTCSVLFAITYDTIKNKAFVSYMPGIDIYLI